MFKMKDMKENMKMNDMKYSFDTKELLFESIVNNNDLNKWIIAERRSLLNEILEIILTDISYYIIYS